MEWKGIIWRIVNSKLFVFLIGMSIGIVLVNMISLGHGPGALRTRLRAVVGSELATEQIELKNAVEACIKPIQINGKPAIRVLYAPEALRNEIPASPQIGQGLVEFQLFGLAAATNCNLVVLDDETIMFYRTN